MNAITNISRRKFLAGTAAGVGGFVLGVTILKGADLRAQIMTAPDLIHIPEDAGSAMNLYLSIAGNGDVVIVAMSPEIGQGARTAMPAIIADELEADWDRVEIVQGYPDPRLGSQSVGGSSAIRDNYDNLRLAGASARTMLERAAAQIWGVPAGECHAKSHQITHEPSGRTLGYGEVAGIAAGLPVPDPAEVRLKTKAEFRYIGTAMGPVDGPDIVRGRAIYGIDTVVPGMKFAVIARSPVIGGKLKSFNADKALAVPGVERVIEVEGGTEPPGFNSVGGLAVIAGDTWTAKKGRDLLEIEWDDGPNGEFDSGPYRAELEAAVAKPGTVARNRGDTYGALEAASKVLTADYYVPHHVHAPMEPPAAVADVRDGRAEVWMPNQDPTGPHREIARVLDLPMDKVTIHTTLSGGGFGRKGKPDYGIEAALLSKASGSPVKVVWTREDDIQHSYYHATAAQHMKAGIDSGGKVTSWLHRVASPSISSTFSAGITEPSDGEMSLGCTDVPWDIPHIRCEKGQAVAHLRIGWFRSVDNINHAFAVSSFVDELAHETGRDTAELLLEMIGGPRHITLAEEGVNYSNHGQDINEFPIDTARMVNVIKAVMKDSGWSRPLAKGRGRGIAFHKSFLTYVAAVVEVEVGDDGGLRISDVFYAVDCGQAVNPDRIRAQFEGGAICGISMALYGEITAKKGRVEQSNFHDYVVTRSDAAPITHVHIVDSDARPTGVGEPPVPPIAPALCNAIFAATGKRIRSLPIGDQLKI